MKKHARKAKSPVPCPNSQSTTVHKTCTPYICQGTTAIPSFILPIFNTLEQGLAEEKQRSS